MLPPPTTIAVSIPRPCTRATSAAIASTRSGSVPYSLSPIRASPDSLSMIRRNTAGPACATSRWAVSATDCEPCEAANDDVLARLCGQRGPQLLDRLASVLVLVDVLLA